MICELLLNINFWAALCGLFGTILIFFFGLPPKVDPSGHTYLICEQKDEDEKRKGKKYKFLSYTGLALLGLSFVLQIINLIFKN
jgi:hypothetical protein